ncbi:hypothetical protein PR202_ga07684 [Eleusine coracana subsp. coracana]|uniref:Uncharacterized protein n=1 Tax=Eleusine coracana subsp. coracana TaxID=191504 RepID=A0AAV5BZB9_ELECO|nr:hypothetical protein PR202_ga07684 [Eleusine coracana subsp. coracana]
MDRVRAPETWTRPRRRLWSPTWTETGNPFRFPLTRSTPDRNRAYALYGGGAAYFWVVVACSTGSLSYALAKAAAMLPRHAVTIAVPEAMIGLSLTLAVAHLAVAYRTSCRERRRQLVYRIDVEAIWVPSPLVSAKRVLPVSTQSADSVCLVLL